MGRSARNRYERVCCQCTRPAKEVRSVREAVCLTNTSGLHAIGVDVSRMRYGTSSTRLLRGRADIHHIQELLGHRSLTTTALYTRVAIEDLRQLVARARSRR
jgi:site-specific recombinase XerD